MDDLSLESPVDLVTFMKSTQVAGTECGNNFVGYVIDHAPGPTMMVQPTVDLAKRWSRQRLTPMIDEMECLNSKIKPARARDSGNTVLSKEFDGGILIMSGANSAAGLRSMPVKYLVLDEIDNYPHDVDGEGDPVKLARERRKNFTRGKELNISSPKTKDVSRIEKGFVRGDQRRYYVPCPHCNEKQTLEFGHLKYELDSDGDLLPETVAYACIHCGGLIAEYHKTWMLENGCWIAEGKLNNKHHSYHINALYSPLGWESWSEIVQKFLEAKDDKAALKTFVNTIEGLPYEETVNKIAADVLRARAEDYPLRECPMGTLVLSAGVDTQPDRFEVVVWGHGLNNHSWAIDYHIIYGSPSQTSVRRQLDEYLSTPFPHIAGCELMIQPTAIDSGGHNTQDIYDYCRIRKHRKIFATKGYSVSGRPIIGKPTKVDVTTKGRTLKKGAEVWMVGSDTAKLYIYNRLQIDDPDSDGYIHFSKHLPKEFFKQIVSEKLDTIYSKGHPRLQWVLPPGVRNEVLDCTVGAFAAAFSPFLGINKWRPAQWRALEELVQPATPDLFASAAAEDRDEQVATAAPRANGSRKRARKRGKGKGLVSGAMSGL